MGGGGYGDGVTQASSLGFNIKGLQPGDERGTINAVNASSPLRWRMVARLGCYLTLGVVGRGKPAASWRSDGWAVPALQAGDGFGDGVTQASSLGFHIKGLQPGEERGTINAVKASSPVRWRMVARLGWYRTLRVVGCGKPAASWRSDGRAVPALQAGDGFGDGVTQASSLGFNIKGLQPGDERGTINAVNASSPLRGAA